MFVLISPGALGETEMNTVLIALLNQTDEGLRNALCHRAWRAIVSSC